MTHPCTFEQLQARLLQKEQELALANECLARFTYGMSHELNAPVRTLNNLLALFNEDVASQIDDEAVELLAMIKKSAARTQNIVDRLLDYSWHSHPVTVHQRIDTRQIVMGVVKQLQTVIDQCGADIQVAELPDVHATPEAIHTLFQHLIDNALTFTTAKDKPPQISIYGHSTVDAVEFVVEDRGMGIDPAESESIFTVFKRLHARSDFEGAGLGLAVCKQIVNALNGGLWVSPAQPHGAAFHVLIPSVK